LINQIDVLRKIVILVNHLMINQIDVIRLVDAIRKIDVIRMVDAIRKIDVIRLVDAIRKILIQVNHLEANQEIEQIALDVKETR